MSAPIIVSALFGAEDQARFDRLRAAHFPPERNHLPAHMTLSHHLPPTVLAELQQRLTVATRGVPAPTASAAGLMNLGRGVAVRIDSPGLAAIQQELADAFEDLLIPQDRGRWRGHVTVQNKVEPAVARATLDGLAADFRPQPVRIAGIGTYWYRGGPWEAISRHMFA